MSKIYNKQHVRYFGDLADTSGTSGTHPVSYTHLDAPLTHCVKEYFIKKILHDPAGKAAAHEAMLHFFPEIMEHAITVCMDEDGVQRLYDKDGECLGEVSE